jgi:hypothetical protein
MAAIALATSPALSPESRLSGVKELTIRRPRARSISAAKGGLIGIFVTPQALNSSILTWPKEFKYVFEKQQATFWRRTLHWSHTSNDQLIRPMASISAKGRPPVLLGRPDARPSRADFCYGSKLL